MLYGMGDNYYRILKFQPSEHFSKIRLFKKHLKERKNLREDAIQNTLKKEC